MNDMEIVIAQSPKYILLASGVESMPLHELLAQGGVAMYPLYAMSFIGVSVFLKKLIELRLAALTDQVWQKDALAGIESRDDEMLKAAVARTRNPAARILRTIAPHLADEPEIAEKEARRLGGLALQKLEQGQGLLAFVAQAAPLLGLLGTVIGMVDLFMGLQGDGVAQPGMSELASGIWKALLTTAAGLTIAVPAMAAHSYIDGCIERFRLSMSDILQRAVVAARRKASAEERSAYRGV